MQRHDPRSLFVLALLVCVVTCVAVGACWYMFGRRDWVPATPTTHHLIVVVPDSYYGEVSLYDGHAPSASAHSQTVLVTDAGEGTLPNASIVNRGFVLEARRVDGRQLPQLSEMPSPIDGAFDYIVLSESGSPNAAISLRVVRGRK